MSRAAKIYTVHKMWIEIFYRDWFWGLFIKNEVWQNHFIWFDMEWHRCISRYVYCTLNHQIPICQTAESILANQFSYPYLDVHLDNGFPYESCSKEGPERYQEMTACDSSKIKQGVWNLPKGHKQDAYWRVKLHSSISSLFTR